MQRTNSLHAQVGGASIGGGLSGAPLPPRPGSSGIAEGRVYAIGAAPMGIPHQLAPATHHAQVGSGSLSGGPQQTQQRVFIEITQPAAVSAMHNPPSMGAYGANPHQQQGIAVYVGTAPAAHLGRAAIGGHAQIGGHGQVGGHAQVGGAAPQRLSGTPSAPGIGHAQVGGVRRNLF